MWNIQPHLKCMHFGQSHKCLNSVLGLSILGKQLLTNSVSSKCVKMQYASEVLIACCTYPVAD